jgi:hypothetical protein
MMSDCPQINIPDGSCCAEFDGNGGGGARDKYVDLLGYCMEVFKCMTMTRKTCEMVTTPLVAGMLR